jgi:RND family efflux transporter MFP subunit
VKLLRLVLPLLVVLAGAGIALALYLTRPEVESKTPPPFTILVETITAAPATRRVVVPATGTVEAARRVRLQPEVAGKVVEVSDRLIPGGHFAADELLLRIDPRDYQHAVEQARARVAEAELALRQEEGRGAVAEREWQLFEEDVPATEAGKALALRRPHLQRARAALAAARSQLEKARRDLERTRLRAPFPALVLEESVDPGQHVSPQTPVATLVGTEAYWVRVAVPVDDLRWLDWPGRPGGEGSAAVVVQNLGDGRTRERRGRVVRLLGDLDPAGRLARLLVRIADPLARGDEAPADAEPLLLNAYVRVRLQGRELAGVFVLPRRALRDGEKVWIMDEEDRLAIRPVRVAWRGATEVYVDEGLAEGERIVVSNIPTATPGLRLMRTATAECAAGDEESAGAGPAGNGDRP